MAVGQNESSAHEISGASLTPARNRRLLLSAAVIAALLILSAFALVYQVKTYTGYFDKQTQDIAQVARNIASGRGFITNIIRVSNLGFVRNGDNTLPEINRAPLYPYALGFFLQHLSVSGQVVERTSILFFVLLLMTTYGLGHVLFGPRVGLMSAAMIGLSAKILDIARSGQEWTAVGLWFTLFIFFVALYHKASINSKRAQSIICSISMGISLGLLYLTHLALFFMVIPAVIYLGITGKMKRLNVTIFVVVFGLITGFCIASNANITSSPLMAASAWDIMAGTKDCPGDTLYRQILNPEFSSPASLIVYPFTHLSAFAGKFIFRGYGLFNGLISMLGLIGLPFAAASALYKFKNPQINAVRGMGYACGAIALFALASFNASLDSIVIFCPLIAVIASGYLFLLLDSKKLHPVFERYILVGIVLIALVPSVSNMMWPVATENHLIDDQLIDLMSRARVSGVVFTDNPWLCSWASVYPCAFVPNSENGLMAIEGIGSFDIFILTGECNNYPANDIWVKIYQIRWWRNYLDNPQKAVSDVVQNEKIDQKTQDIIRKSITRQSRTFNLPISDLENFKQVDDNQMMIKDLVVLVRH